MRVSKVSIVRVAALAAALGLVTACSSPASYQVRMAYLEKMAKEGVQTHRLLASQGAVTTAKRCTSDYQGLQDQNPPSDEGDDTGPSDAWISEIQSFFVQSCVTGLPKTVPGQPASSPSGKMSPTNNPSSGPSPIASPAPTR